MAYIDTTKAQQIVSISKDYLGTQFLSYVKKEANGCSKNDWSSLLCFYQLYRLAKHRTSDLINDASYQSIIISLLGKIALTPNYGLATCNSGVIIANGGCGCQGGTTTTGQVSGCVDSIWAFHMNTGDTIYENPVFIGVDLLIAIREGIVMSTSPLSIGGYVFNNVAGAFIPNSPISDQGEDFVILYNNCNGGGSIVPPVTQPQDIEFQVGVTGGAPAAGTTIYTNPILANRLIRLNRSGISQTLIGYAGGEGYTTPNSSGTFSVNPPWVDQEYVKIEVYK